MRKIALTLLGLMTIAEASGFAALKQKIHEAWPAQEIEFQCDQKPLEESFKNLDEAAIRNIEFSPDKKRFKVDLQITPQKQAVLTGRIYPLTQIPVLTRAIPPGEIIQESDIGWNSIKSDNVMPHIILSAKDLEGMISKHRVLQPQQPLSRHDLQLPVLIKKGQWVQVVYKTPGLSIGTQAEAKNDAALNQPVKLLRPGSKNIIDAVATGPGQAEIKPMVF